VYRDAPPCCRVCGRSADPSQLDILDIAVDGNGFLCARCSTANVIDERRRHRRSRLARLWDGLTRLFRSERQRWLGALRELPISAIRDAVLGSPVRIVGAVSLAPGGTPLQAPFTHRACVAYTTSIVQWDEDGYSTVAQGPQVALPLVVSDWSGNARVQPVDVELILPEGLHVESGSTLDFPRLTHAPFRPPSHYREARVEEGTVVAVMGIPRLDLDGQTMVIGSFASDRRAVVTTEPDFLS
jgi:hypothetical protein